MARMWHAPGQRLAQKSMSISAKRTGSALCGGLRWLHSLNTWDLEWGDDLDEPFILMLHSRVAATAVEHVRPRGSGLPSQGG
jgi:hypothetical protein